MASQYYEWTVKISVHPRWVADGFSLTESRLQTILENVFTYAYENEYYGKVLKSPDPYQIQAEQEGAEVEGRKPRLCDCGLLKVHCVCERP